VNIRHQIKRLLLKLGYYKYPDFLIIGAQKSGTTYLYSILRQHPQIVEPVNKEAHFFDYDWNYDAGLFRYQLNFDLSFRFKKEQKTFEATPDYLPHKLAPSRIKKFFPNIKMIVVLREPISRAYSAWKMHHYLFENHPKYSWLHDPRSFESVIEDALEHKTSEWDLMNHIGRGLYGMQLENFFTYFDRKNFLVLFQDDLLAKPQEQINKICSFLKIEEQRLTDVNKEDPKYWTNKSVNPNKTIEEIPSHDKLTKYFEHDKGKLETLVKMKIPW